MPRLVISNDSDDRNSRLRWYRLAVCIVAMMAAANLQYAWTLFTTPLTIGLAKPLSAIQVAFTTFVIAQTWLLPASAYLIDRLGTRLIISIAGVLVGVSWIGSGLAHSLPVLYVAYTLGGIGVGAVYGGCIGLAMKWFPDHRGLCVGVVAGAYGFGTAVTGIPISMMISSSGYQKAFITWGIIQGLVVLAAAQFMRPPQAGWVPRGWEKIKAKVQSRVLQSSKDYTPGEMLRTSSFYGLYLMMTIVAFSGLMVTAQLEPIASTYGFNKQILFGGVTVLALTVTIDGVLNGVTRPMFGWISDHIGRYDTMAVAFFLEAVTITTLTFVGSNAILFIVTVGLTFFAWGEIYSLFPSAIADVFGTRHSTTNFGIQYTAKGLASILAAPGAALLTQRFHSWTPVLWVAVVCNIVASMLAVLWLKPIVKRLTRNNVSGGIAESKAASSETEVGQPVPAQIADR